MDTPQTYLRNVWAEFRKARYTDEQEIVTYIAYLLTKDLEPLREDLRIEKPKNRYGVEEELIMRDLLAAGDLLKEQGRLATLFDQYVLFHSSWVRTKGTYPIPRHIVDFMITLLQVQPGQHFADFTCGTGGFLVHRNGKAGHPAAISSGSTVGVEVSPALARIAGANALLHRMNKANTHIYIGNAFRVCAELPAFDRIAMAPPFGMSIDPQMSEPLLGKTREHTSEFLFPLLTLQKLKTDGQAILMVPPGITNTDASLVLRETLIEQHTLKAVISLGENILQPFTPQPVYLLLIAKNKTTPPQPTWFLDITYDGYPLNASRDLMAEPSSVSDFPLAIAALLPNQGEREVFQLVPLAETANHQMLYIKPLGSISGVVLKIPEHTTLTAIRLFQPTKHGNILRIETIRRGGQSVYTAIPLPTTGVDMGAIVHIVDSMQWVRDLYSLPSTTPEEELPEGTYIFGGGSAGQMIAITADGRLLGFTKTSADIVEGQYAFTDRYRKIHAEPQKTMRSTAELLQEILTNQEVIADYVDSLLGQLEVKHILAQPLPPPLFNIAERDLPSYLSTEQDAIWQAISEHIDITKKYALYFTPDQLPTYTHKRVLTEQTLELLETMGLIVQVTIKHPQTGNILRCYRKVTELDRKQW